MAERKGFNLAEALASVSKSDTGVDRIELIDIARLGDDPRNFYQLSDLDGLAENIELVGLQQPLRVRPDPEAPGYYVIVSGHRRRAAIRMLVASGRDDLRKIPCIVERPAESEAMQELRLIFANSGTRRLTDPEIAAQADRVTDLLYRLKEEGCDFPGRMRDHVAEACRVSKSKLARLKVIEAGLAGTLMPRWKAGTIPESVAYELARMPEALQTRIDKVTRGKLPDASTLEILRQRSANGETWEPSMCCPDGKPCSHSDGFLRRAIDAPWDDTCTGGACCLTCNRGGCASTCAPCARMCSKAKAALSERQSGARKASESRADKARRRAQRKTIPYARRIVRAADDAGIEDSVKVPWLHFNGLSINVIRRWAEGDFSEGWQNYFFGSQLKPGDLRYPIEAATALHCSADYLLGLTDDLHPGAAPAGYITGGDPKAPTEAMVLLDCGMERPFRTTAEWRDGQWLIASTPVTDRVLAWYPIPPTPDLLTEEDSRHDDDHEEDDDSDQA